MTALHLIPTLWLLLQSPEPPNPHITDAPIKVDVKIVNVLCTVYDHRGALVTDLTKDDFEVRENGIPQPIRYFARETDLPLTLALLLDVSGSVQRFVQSEKETAIQFLRNIVRPQDLALLSGFSSTVLLWSDFTPSVPLLRDALTRMHSVPFRGIPKDGGPMPSTILYDAVAGTSRDKLNAVPGRKAMVVISDGIDIGSRATLETAVRQAQTANAIVYSICYPTPPVSGCGNLKSLSEPTGGRMFDLSSKIPLSQIFRIIEDELRSQYALGFTPAATGPPFRKLQVKVNRPGMKIQARKGYYSSNP